MNDITMFFCVNEANQLFDFGTAVACSHATLTSVLIDFSGAPIVYLDSNGDGTPETEITYWEHLELDIPWLKCDLYPAGQRRNILLVHDRDTLIEKAANPKSVITLKPKQYAMHQHFNIKGGIIPQCFRVNLYDSDGVSTRLYSEGMDCHVYITLHNATRLH